MQPPSRLAGCPSATLMSLVAEHSRLGLPRCLRTQNIPGLVESLSVWAPLKMPEHGPGAPPTGPCLYFLLDRTAVNWACWQASLLLVFVPQLRRPRVRGSPRWDLLLQLQLLPWGPEQTSPPGSFYFLLFWDLHAVSPVAGCPRYFTAWCPDSPLFPRRRGTYFFSPDLSSLPAGWLLL